MLSKGLHRSQASIFNKLECELHTRGEASPLLQMFPAGARTSYPPNTPFLGDIFGLLQPNQTWGKTRATEAGQAGKLGEKRGDAQRALKKCFSKN